MSIEFRCAECTTCYEVEDDLAGKTIRCRECNALNRVLELMDKKREAFASGPRPSTIPSSRATIPFTAPDVQKPRSLLSTSFTKGFLAGVLLMGLVSGLGLWWILSSREREVPAQAVNAPPSVVPQQPSAVQPTPTVAQVIPQASDPNEILRHQQEAIEAERRRQAQLQQQAKQAAAQEVRRRKAEEKAQALALKQAAEEAERRYQEKLAQEFALLNGLEQRALSAALKAFTAAKPPKADFSLLAALDRHWIFFDNER